MLFRLMGDDDQGGPGVWESCLFTAPSAELPGSWTATVDDQGVLTIGPEAWRRRGFWEAYFDGDADAIQEFNDELVKLLAR